MACIDARSVTAAPQPVVEVPVADTEEERLLARFVRSNGDIYLATYRKMLAKDPSIRQIVHEWNWSAFWGILPWMLYRKMWTFAVLVLGPGLAETTVLGHTVPALNLLIVIYAVMVSKSFYVRSAVRRIRALRARGLSDEELLARVEAKGVSRTGLVVGLILMLVGTYGAIANSIAAMHH